MYKEIWDLVSDLIDSRYENIDEGKYRKDVKAIKEDIEALASKIEQDKDDEFEYHQSGDARFDAACNKAGV